MFRKLGLVLFAVMMVVALVPAGADAGNGNGKGRGNGNGGDSGTTVPGHAGRTGYVNGHYTSVYAYDASGAFYWDLGDGRIQGTVGSIDALDANTLTVCDYVVNYRADFGGDPYMNEGWIQNHITCSGYDDNSTYNYLIVSPTDPRYTGNPDWAVWGTWEYHVYTVSGEGNLVGRPMKEPGNLG